MTSASHVSLLSTSLLLVVNLSTLTQGWRWPSASQTVQSFSDLLGIKDRTPQTIKGSQQQQNGATTKHLWSSLGAKPGSVGHVRNRGLDVISPYSPYGLIHKVISMKQPSNSLLLRCYGTVGDRGKQSIIYLGIFIAVRLTKL